MAAERKDRLRRLGRDRDDADLAERRACRRLEGGEVMVERADILGHAFRQEDAVRATCNRGAEIVERKTARQRIDADIAKEAVSTLRLEKVARKTPGGRTVRGGSRGFETED